MESASALFRTGNYRATMECFDLLASTKLEFGINGAVLDGLFTLVGQDTLRERFVTGNFCLNFAQGYIFTDVS